MLVRCNRRAYFFGGPGAAAPSAPALIRPWVEMLVASEELKAIKIDDIRDLYW